MKQLLYFLTGLIFVSSCDNSLDVVGPSEETIVAYCLLNASDSLHYIKVNKGFISSETAPVELAKDPDQLFFDSLVVEIIDLTQNTLYRAKKESWQKEPGQFTNAVNYLYTFKADLTPGHEYRLYIQNPLTGKEAFGTLNLLGGVQPQYPGSNTINSLKIVPGTEFPVIYEANRYAAEYETVMRFIYEEIDQSSSTIRRDTVTWIMSRGKFDDDALNKTIRIRTDGQLFYDYLASQLEVKGPEIRRRGLFLQFEYWTADKELSVYSEVYGTSSIGVVQKTTDYTNIDGGYGLFASRNNFKLTGQVLGGDIQAQLKTNPVMSPYNFSD